MLRDGEMQVEENFCCLAVFVSSYPVRLPVIEAKNSLKEYGVHYLILTTLSQPPLPPTKTCVCTGQFHCH